MRRATLRNEAITDPERSRQPRLEAGELALKMWQCRIDNELHRQTAILHRLRVALLPTSIVGVVVDPVCVPRYGRITEDKGVRELEVFNQAALAGGLMGFGKGLLAPGVMPSR